ncbi:glycoside hydrolase N-terminal domain-containing protein [Paenibacillus allorhizosphaerae]|uniref:Glycoside hydrolase family 95 protein n=1 Tax=Paenibacillus allorhizosphaerae TaxID=2849866 RepID=A0ABM8VDF8_9BACL|nr:glycoside hydrolase N-terminal domain-containing protein [Paenibacillus allorhizosphaerae]CAG7627398.1 hypothetical protein PAECIP111802_01350 [Paenibacillus allorhizosphaerae]
MASGKNRLYLKYPASWWGNMWREALPSGNGTVGASVFGAVKDESVIINHADLWHGGQKDSLPDVSDSLQETRKLMNERKYAEASWHLTNALKDKGYNTRLASRLPLAELMLNMPCGSAFKQYKRSLNMETGEVSVTWNDDGTVYERNLFVSRTNDCIVYEIHGSGDSVEGLLRLGFRKSENPNMAVKCKELEDTASSVAEDQYLFFAARNDDGTDYGAVLRLRPLGGAIRPLDGGLQFSGSSKVTALVKVFVKGERERDWNRLRNELAAIDQPYEQLLEAHVRLHGRLFHSASLELGADNCDRERSNEELLLDAYDGEAPTALIEKLWSFGRYLFISGTAPKSNPFGMYGLWAGDYRLVWCHNMANENVQMMYWHAPVGGLAELMPALVRYYDSMMDDFRECARKLYGCRGIYIPAGSTPGIGVPNQIVPVIMNWTGAAGWLARHYYEYYLFTGDREFLILKVLPFMREVALFYEDFLELGEDGFYKYYPSVSPENTPVNFMPPSGEPLAHPMPTTINATMDIAILKELLTHLIEGTLIAGDESGDVEKWERMLRRIPPYQINEDGAVREWMHPDFDDRYDHRHLSHIYPIFPGQEVTREEKPGLFQAFDTAVRKRLIGAQSGWSLAHMSAIYSRLGDGGSALDCLDILARSCLLNNLFTLHNDWRNMGICMNRKDAPIQLDASMGVINAVQEMLLFVSPRIVKLLPAVPAKWKRGKAEGLRYTNGRLSLSWDSETGMFEAVIQAERETDIVVRLPEWLERYQLSGSDAEWSKAQTGHNGYAVRLKPGGTLHIRSEALIGTSI